MNDEINAIKVWDIKRKWLSYQIMDGNSYRKIIVNNCPKGKYTIEFRTNIPEDTFNKLLVKTVSEHIFFSKIIFSNIFNQENNECLPGDEFVNLIVKVYEIPEFTDK